VLESALELVMAPGHKGGTLRSRGVLIIGCAAVFVSLLLGSCSLNKPTQAEAQQAFAALTQGTSSVSSSSGTETRTGPPTWTYEYVLQMSNGGSIVLDLSITSSYDLNSTPAPGMNASFSGTMTFKNFSTGSYTFDGSLALGGQLNVTSASNGDTLMTESFTYQGKLNVTGQGVSTMDCNMSASVTIDLTTYQTTAGPTYSGTVTFNGNYSYPVSSLGARAVPLNILKLIR